MALTLNPGTLIVASAYPDPPFNVMENGAATGFDIELMRAICAQLELTLQPVPYSGDDFNGIFDGLAKGSCDAVISGATITPSAPPSRCSAALSRNSTKVLPSTAADPKRRLYRRPARPDRGHPIGQYLRPRRPLAQVERPDRRHQVLSLPWLRRRARRPRSRTHRSRDQALSRDLLAGPGALGAVGRNAGADPREARHRLCEGK